MITNPREVPWSAVEEQTTYFMNKCFEAGAKRVPLSSFLVVMDDGSTVAATQFAEDDSSKYFMLMRRTPIYIDDNGNKQVALESFSFSPVVRLMNHTIGALSPLFGEIETAYYSDVLSTDPEEYGATSEAGKDEDIAIPFARITEKEFSEWQKTIKDMWSKTRSYLSNNGPLVLKPIPMASIDDIIDRVMNGEVGDDISIDEEEDGDILSRFDPKKNGGRPH